MKNSKHTPGPWRASPSDRKVNYTVRAKGHAEAVFSTDEVLANAALIAAAPEMLEALEFLVGFCGLHDFDKTDKPIKQVWDAIAKARGEL